MMTEDMTRSFKPEETPLPTLFSQLSLQLPQNVKHVEAQFTLLQIMIL